MCRSDECAELIQDLMKFKTLLSQQAITCSKSIIETLEKGVIHV